MYSLVNIAVVVRDLSRHPQAEALAADLLAVLALDPAALAELESVDGPGDAAAHRAALSEPLLAAPRALHVLATARAASESAGFAAWSSSLGLLEAAPMGGWDELQRWLRDELLAQAWERAGDLAVARHPGAVAVVVDGVLATYAGAVAGHPLARPWRTWRTSHPVAAAGDAAVSHLVSRVAAATAGQLARAGEALRDARHAGWSWPLAMHDACWALELTGRTRTAAAAQLEMLRALVSGSRSAPRADVVAAAVAAIHATVAADVLTEETVTAMRRPLLVALG